MLWAMDDLYALIFENGIQFHGQPHGSLDFQLTHHIGHGGILRAVHDFFKQGAGADQRCVRLSILVRYNRRIFGCIYEDDPLIAEIKFDFGLDGRGNGQFLAQAGCDRFYAHVNDCITAFHKNQTENHL